MFTRLPSLDERLQPKSEDDYLNDTYTIKTNCVDCGKTYTCKIPASGLYQYRMVGAMTQVAFPNLTPSDRELHFVSGMCGHCFDRLFDGMEDESAAPEQVDGADRYEPEDSEY